MRRVFLALALLLPLAASAQEGFPIGPGPGQYPGTATNDSACTGCVGEVLDFTAALSSVSISTGTAKTVISGSITAGDWQVTCQFNFTPNAATTTSMFYGELSTADNTVANTTGRYVGVNFVSGSLLTVGQPFSISTPPARITLAASTTHYCVTQATFGTNVLTAGARLHALRVR